MIRFNVKRIALVAVAATALMAAVPVAASARQLFAHVQIGGGRTYDRYYGGYVVYDDDGRWVDAYGNYHYRNGRWYDREGSWHDNDDWGWRDSRRWGDEDGERAREWREHHDWDDRERGDRDDRDRGDRDRRHWGDDDD